MLNKLKNIIAGIFPMIGYQKIPKPKKLNDVTGDGSAILRLLLQSEKVSVIIVGAVSIGDTSQKFSNLFPNVNIFVNEPNTPPYHCIKIK